MNLVIFFADDEMSSQTNVPKLSEMVWAMHDRSLARELSFKSLR